MLPSTAAPSTAAPSRPGPPVPEAVAAAIAGLLADAPLVDALIAYLPLGVVVVNPAGELVAANAAARALLPDQLPPRPLEGRRADGRPLAAHEWPLARALAHGETVAPEPVALTRADGPPRWLAMGAMPVGASQGTIVAGVLTLDDVTGRRDAEAALDDALEGMSDAFFAYDRTLRLVRLNGAARRWIAEEGIDPAAVVGRVVWDALPDIVREPLGDALRRVVADGTPTIVESCSPRTGRWVEARLYPTATGVVCYSLDVSARKRLAADAAAEQARLYEAERAARREAERAAARASALQAVASALVSARRPPEIADAILRLGMPALGATRGAVATVSPDGAALELVAGVGYDAASLARFGHIPLATLFPLTDAARTRTPVLLASDAERDAHYPQLARLRRTNGGGAMAALPLLVGERLLGAVGFNFPEQRPLGATERDFLLALAQQCAQALDRARLDAAERAARNEAEAANRARSEFMAVMSHELRTPLNAILGYADLLDAGVAGALADPQRAFVARSRDAARRLLALVEDVLSFARLEAGRVAISVAPTPLRALVAPAVAVVAPQAAQRGLALAVDDGDALDALHARADRERAGQVLLNLLSNAMKFTPAGGRIALSAAADDACVRLAVADTGIGIAADQHERIFEPYVQVGHGLTRPTEGTGLGLAISRELARAMGGDVTVASAPGAGSTFTLTLPRVDPA